MLLPQIHDGAHVDIIERRQHGGSVLRLFQTACDGLAQTRHANTLFTRTNIPRSLRFGRCRSRLRRAVYIVHGIDLGCTTVAASRLEYQPGSHQLQRKYGVRTARQDVRPLRLAQRSTRRVQMRLAQQPVQSRQR